VDTAGIFNIEKGTTFFFKEKTKMTIIVNKFEKEIEKTKLI